MYFTAHNHLSDSVPTSPVVTVFCAVWHRQPQKEALLRTHWENLKSQTLPVQPCYIFDNGDQAPDWLDAPWYSFSEPLSIYEAWSAGVALTTTPYVMNLNLDDRLADDACAILLHRMLKTGRMVACSDWEVRFDSAFMEKRFSASSLEGFARPNVWPPEPGIRQCLGTSNPQKMTLGPSILWNLYALGKWYPSYFCDGGAIQSIGDAVFWGILRKKGIEVERVPLILGRYHSAPATQAEFRPHDDLEKFDSHGLSAESFACRLRSGSIKCLNDTNISTVLADTETLKQALTRLAPSFLQSLLQVPSILQVDSLEPA